jgi:bifunctional UDP-N-acetylglucosamine pyrophosphorylase/glucosamine-1-phosphate N-acetyltransferase
MEHFSDIAVVVLAAGKGKRMNNPNLAKVMALLGGKPLIHYVIDQVMVLDPSDILLVVGFQKQSIIDYIDGLSIPYLKFVEQTEQLGTGHAVAQAQSVLDGFASDVLILAGDVPLITADTLQKFIYKHRTDQADISVLTAIVPEPTGYGRIIRNDIGEFLKITEEKDATDDERLINEVKSSFPH